MLIKSLKCALGLMVMSMAGTAFTSEDILIENFEEGLHDTGWIIEGDDDFGEIADRMNKTGITGMQREKFVYTALFAGNDSKGKLTSRPFELDRDYINFLIGGGGSGAGAERGSQPVGGGGVADDPEWGSDQR